MDTHGLTWTNTLFSPIHSYLDHSQAMMKGVIHEGATAKALYFYRELNILIQ